jgi:hypothetical protein
LILSADGLDSIADALVSFIVWFGTSMLQRPKKQAISLWLCQDRKICAFVAAIVNVL